MPFKPGHQKIGGNKKGESTTKRTVVRDIIEAALGQTLPEALLEIANSLSDREKRLKSDILSGLMAYSYPRLQSTYVEADVKAALDTKEDLAVAVKLLMGE